MTVETRPLQIVTEGSGANPSAHYDVPERWEFRIVCDQCGTASPWHPAQYPEEPSLDTPPAWFMAHAGDQTTHTCGYCAGGGGKLPIPRTGTIWWSHGRPRSVSKIVASDPLGSVSVSVIYTPKDVRPTDKRLQPLSGAILLPVREFYGAWGRPKPDDNILSPRTIWLNFAHSDKPVTIDGAEYLGGATYIVCSEGKRFRFEEFVRTHVPTENKLPRSRYERILEDNLG